MHPYPEQSAAENDSGIDAEIDTATKVKRIDDLWNNTPEARNARWDRDFNHFKYPVFPNKAAVRSFGFKIFSYSASLPNKSYSALALATRGNHLDVMKVLLDAGANTLDEHHAVTPRQLDSRATGGFDISFYSHHSVISHVRSVAAAKLLLESGAGAHINVLGKTKETPLETLLYRCACFRHEEKLDMTFSEIYHLVQFLIRHGASPRAVTNSAPMAPFFGYTSIQNSPLTSAMALKSLEIFNLILRSGPQPFDPSTPECETVMLISLGLKNSTSDSAWAFNDPDFQVKILRALLDSGLSPSHRRNSQKSILTSVLKRGNERVLATLIEWQADLNSLGTRELCAVSAAVFAREIHETERLRFIEQVVQGGADINQPSFGPGGLTPLAYATADGVSDEIFKGLLSLGARRTGFYQLVPGNGPWVSIMQCLLSGRPGLLPSGASITFNSYTLPDFHSAAGWAREEDKLYRRRMKFDAFVRCPNNASLFRLGDGTHILKWILKVLRGTCLTWALDRVLPYYENTKLPQDKEQEKLMMSLCDETERMGCLAFGTLGHLPNLVWALIQRTENSINVKHNGETVLHRVCKINPGCNDRVHWDRTLGYHRGQGNYLAYCTRFQQTVNRHRPMWDPWDIRYEDLIQFQDLYSTERTASILITLRILETFGANYEIKDDHGKRPIDYVDKSSELYTCMVRERLC